MTQNRGCIPEKDKHFSLQHLAFNLSLSTVGPSCCSAAQQRRPTLVVLSTCAHRSHKSRLQFEIQTGSVQHGV